ncbi:hypothetical protein TNCV_373271 [Trichonephila clavipes]|nr:hypothetical protein TNCV_373271 [Trichonephila clavipes]
MPANFQAQRVLSQLPRECPSSTGTPPVTQECARGIPALLRLENLPKFKDICDGTFPNPVHEGVHEEDDISYCIMLKSYQFAKYLQQFNKLHAEWS